ncbi:hypothetical protein [Algicella marina]|uniref:Uncharacterized protein n=1 Tax=Algicella marina TaxID=2683284 RepID=A0A6P1T2I3_9RHOB|nr:hypothetical protein [Algicella marina]QHQ35931.1 hypothetical protein GO499_12500 [Algicella marina]
MPPPIRRVYDDRATSDILYGSSNSDRFILVRDQKPDEIRWFRDGEDFIKLWSWDINFSSLLVARVSLLEYQVFVRDEVITVKFVRPPASQIPDDGVLLDADDFIFKKNLPEPPVQVHLEQSSTDKEILTGTTLPDVFVFTFDGKVDVIRLYELHKDQIDLSGYATSFDDVSITTNKKGTVAIRIDTELGPDFVRVHDPSNRFTADDFTADDFIF